MSKFIVLVSFFLIPLISVAQIPKGHFLDADDNAEKGYKLKPFIQEKEGIYHYAILTELPFENNCSINLSQEEQIKCSEETLNQLIIDNWGEPGYFKSSSYVYLTINEKGEPIDIKIKSYPHEDEIEPMYVSAIKRIKFKPAKYKGKIVKSRLWAKFEYE